MFAIFKREFKTYFQTVVGWLFIAVILALFGLYFVAYNLMQGYPTLSNTLNSIEIFLIFLLPILSMRVLSEDRSKKTDQLILTSPVSVEKIVLAKYLAMSAIFSIFMVFVSLTPILLRVLGATSLKQSYVSIIGFWLFGLALLGIGIFVSALTESQVIAYVITVLILFVGFMMSSISSLFPSTLTGLTKVLGIFDLNKHVTNFYNGIFDVTGVVYYLSFIFIFLFLSIQVIQKRRWGMNSSRIKMGVYSSSLIVIAIVFTFIINLVAVSAPTKYTNFDMSKEKMFTITSKTTKLVSALKSDITIYVLASESSLESSDAILSKTLNNYADASKHIKVVYKDPKTNPLFYQNYTDTAPASNSLIVVSDQRSKVVDYSKLYETSTNYQTYQTETTGYDGEGQITSAIQYVSNKTDKKVYEVTGHGETALADNSSASEFESVIVKANASLESLNLVKEDAVPTDASAVIINGPTSDFSQDDAKKISDYLAAGGKVFLTTEYKAADLPNLDSVLSTYGVTITSGMVFEGDQSNYSQAPYVLLPSIQSDTLTSDVSSGNILVPYAKAITYAASSDDSVTYTDLLKTSDKSYNKADIQKMTSYDKESNDTAGPFTVGLDVKKTLSDDKTAELTIFTSTEMFSDSADEAVSGYNAKLFSSCITNLIGTDDSSDANAVVIPVKSYDTSSITVSAAAAISSGVVLIALLPIVLLILGIGIWAVRRKK